MNLTREPAFIELEPSLFLYAERFGPFAKSALTAWQAFYIPYANVMDQLPKLKVCALTRIDESKEESSRFIYQAGVTLATAPEVVPEGLKLRHGAMAGKFARFLLTGSYPQLPGAFQLAFKILEKRDVTLRRDFCAEIYLNTPHEVPEDSLETEMLIPVV